MSSTVKPVDYTRQIVNLNAQTQFPGQIPDFAVGTSTLGGTQAGDAEKTPRAKPINLFDASSFTASSPTLTAANGQTFQLPTLSAEEAQQAQNVLSRIPEGERDNVNQAAGQLGQALFQFMIAPQATAGTADTAAAPASKAAVGTAVGSVKLASPAGASPIGVSQASPDVQGITTATQQAASTMRSSGLNYDDTVLSTAYAGVQGLQGQLTEYAHYMQNTTNKQNTFRADASEITQALADWPEGTTTQTFTWHTIDKNGEVQEQTGDLTKAQAQAALDDVNSGMTSIGQDTQIQQIQLQQLTQNYQMGIETMSNVLKASYDTTKNTLGNIHY